jgi:hypothetical protein
MVLGITRNREDSRYVEEVCRLHVNTMPFYIRDLRIQEFWYVRVKGELWNPWISRDNCTCEI